MVGTTTGLIQLYTGNKFTVGTHTATVTVKLASYAAVSAVTATFTIQIEGCKVTSFSMAKLSPSYDLSYTIKSTALTWSIVGTSVTTQVPACGYT